MLDGDLFAGMAKLVHHLAQRAALEHQEGGVAGAQVMQHQIGASRLLTRPGKLRLQRGLAHDLDPSGYEHR